MRLDALLDRVTDSAADPLAGGRRRGGGDDRRPRHRGPWSPGALFCCVPGAHVDGHDLAARPWRGGAAALLVERPRRRRRARSCGCRRCATRWARWPLPSGATPRTAMRVVGVTGHQRQDHHHPPARRDHRGARLVHGGASARSPVPAPPPRRPSCRRSSRPSATPGRDAVAMEVSSHALALGRVRATRFAVAVFTNLSHDHLDFHRDLDDYFEAKASLFTPDYADAAVVNLDDPRGRELLTRGSIPTEGFSLADAADLEVGASREPLPLARGADRAAPRRALQRQQRARRPPPPRRPSRRSTRPTIAAGLAGAAPRCPAGSSRSTRASPSRCSSTTPTSPAPSPAPSRPRATPPPVGRVILVFGAGGDRDATKRPEMGEVAARLADRVLLTSDNPRGEDPLAIIDAIRAGMTRRRRLHGRARPGDGHRPRHRRGRSGRRRGDRREGPRGRADRRGPRRSRSTTARWRAERTAGPAGWPGW